MTEHGSGADREVDSADLPSAKRFLEGARELWAARDRREGIAGRARSHVAKVHSIDVVGSQWSELMGAATLKRPA